MTSVTNIGDVDSDALQNALFNFYHGECRGELERPSTVHPDQWLAWRVHRDVVLAAQLDVVPPEDDQIDLMLLQSAKTRLTELQLYARSAAFERRAAGCLDAPCDPDFFDVWEKLAVVAHRKIGAMLGVMSPAAVELHKLMPT